MKEQFNSASKRQQVKADFTKLLYKDFVEKDGNDRRKAFKELKSHNERRLPLFPGNLRHESHKIGFLRDVLVSEDRG